MIALPPATEDSFARAADVKRLFRWWKLPYCWLKSHVVRSPFGKVCVRCGFCAWDTHYTR